MEAIVITILAGVLTALAIDGIRSLGRWLRKPSYVARKPGSDLPDEPEGTGWVIMNLVPTHEAQGCKRVHEGWMRREKHFAHPNGHMYVLMTKTGRKPK